MSNSDALIQRFRGITSTTDPSQLELLDAAVQDLANVTAPETAVPAMLEVFERFPENDGFGVFWSILHAVEGLKGYEPALVSSLERRPSEFGLTMVNRLLNAGVRTVGDTELIDLLRRAADSDASIGVKSVAQRFLAYQTARGLV